MKRRLCFEIFVAQTDGENIRGIKIYVCAVTISGAERIAIRVAKNFGTFNKDLPIKVVKVSILGTVFYDSRRNK